MINLPGTEKVLVSSEVLASLIQSLAACTGFLTLPTGIGMMAEIPECKVCTCLFNVNVPMLHLYSFSCSVRMSSLH